MLAWQVLASELTENFTKFIFWNLFTKISFQDSDTKSSHFSENWRPHKNSKFLPCLILYCGAETLGCLETCLNWVATFWFIFLHLFSNVPGGLKPTRATIIFYNGILWFLDKNNYEWHMASINLWVVTRRLKSKLQKKKLKKDRCPHHTRTGKRS